MLHSTCLSLVILSNSAGTVAGICVGIDSKSSAVFVPYAALVNETMRGTFITNINCTLFLDRAPSILFV